MKIAVIVPSRGRPDNIARLVTAWRDTEVEALLVVCVDEDDPTLDDYQTMWKDSRGHEVGYLYTGERLRLGGTLNLFAPRFALAYDIVGFMGDDHLPRTKHWDQAVIAAAYTTPGAVIYGNDLLQGEALATAVFMDSRIITSIGYMIPPGATHLYFDNAWMEIGRGLGTLRYLSDVVIEHLHPDAGKAERDDQYVEVNSTAMYDHDREVFTAWVAQTLQADLVKIREAIR